MAAWNAKQNLILSSVEAIFPISENCYWSKQLIELKSHKRFCIIFANNRVFFSLRIKRCLLTQTPLVVLKSVLISKRNQGTWWCQHETKESQNGKSGNTEVLYARYDTAWSPLRVCQKFAETVSLDSDSCRIICILPVSYIRVLDAVSPATIQRRDYLEKHQRKHVDFPSSYSV